MGNNYNLTGDISNLSKLNDIQQIRVDYTQVSGSVNTLIGCTKLRELYVNT